MENSALDENDDHHHRQQVIKDTDFKGHKNESFIVDIDRFSSLSPEKDFNVNSRITLQKSVSRKGMQRSTEQKTNLSFNNDRNIHNHSPRANSARVLGASSTLEKPLLVVVGPGAGPTENSINPQQPQHHHNSITIMNSAGCGSAAASASATPEGMLGGRRYSFRRPSSSWTIDPRRILFFFATLSSMGTILLIYFTLSISKVKGDDSLLN